MTNYAILRIAKLKTFGNISASAKHNFRERETLNADSDRLNLNKSIGAQNSTEVLSTVKERLKTVKTIRKNAVLAIEYFIGASPDYFKNNNADDYFKTAKTWLEQKHGKSNVICATIHNDETTPHMCAYVVPIDSKNKLNARAYTGGKQTLSAMQDDFYNAIAHLGLKRGIKKSKAKHIDIKTYYSKLNETLNPNIEIPEPKLLETKSGYAKRIETSLKNQYSDLHILTEKLEQTNKKNLNDLTYEEELKNLALKDLAKTQMKNYDLNRELEKVKSELNSIHNNASESEVLFNSLTNTDKYTILKQMNDMVLTSNSKNNKNIINENINIYKDNTVNINTNTISNNKNKNLKIDDDLEL